MLNVVITKLAILRH